MACDHGLASPPVQARISEPVQAFVGMSRSDMRERGHHLHMPLQNCQAYCANHKKTHSFKPSTLQGESYIEQELLLDDEEGTLNTSIAWNDLIWLQSRILLI